MPDPASTSASGGLLGSLRAAGDRLLGTVQTRLSLLSLELQEEKLRLMQMLIWLSAAMLAGGLALVFLSMALAFWLWERSPVLALSALGVFYALIFVGLAWSFRRYLARQTRPFAATLQELSTDRACIQPEN